MVVFGCFSTTVMTETRESGELVEDIDEKRLNRQAYDYLCRLLEVRTWLSECLKDDSIPPVTEMENTMRNGVVLARLSNFFAPDTVPLGKIFDIDQERYRSDPEGSLQYRHSDNIMLWRRGMESVRLPEIFIPETVDVYEGRNMKTIFCLYALAFHLFRMRKAPPIRNQAGKAIFTMDELAEMRDQLKDSKVPEFGDVGGLLTDKMTEDEKAVAIALEAIEKAVEEKNPETLLSALQNPDCHILYVESVLADKYLENLSKLKENGEKLTKYNVQSSVTEANYSSGVFRLNDLFSDSTEEIPLPILLEVLQWLQFEDVRESAIPLYITMLKEKRRQREIQIEDVRGIITEANALAEVKLATLQGSSVDVVNALKNTVLQLEPREECGRLYYNRLFYNYEKSSDSFFLRRDDLLNIIYEFEEMSSSDRKLLEVSAAAQKGETDTLSILLKELCVDVYVEENIEYYVRKINQRENKTFDVDDLRKMLSETNFTTAQAFDDADLLISLNKAISKGNLKKAHEVLQTIDWHRSGKKSQFRMQLLNWYTQRLFIEMRERQRKRGESVKKEETAEKEEPKENGYSHDKVEQWFYHDFLLGTVYMEIEETRQSTKRKEPINETYLQWNEFESVFSAENAAFDNYYSQNEDAIKKSQNAMRKYLEKKRTRENTAEKVRRDNAAKTIQDNYRKFSYRKDQEELRSSEAPSLRLVRKFVTYLQDRDYDVNEELEIEEKKSRVTQLVVSNQELDGELQELDEKIGLLIKNRINLQDVIAHKNKISDDADRFAFRPFSVRKKDKDSTEKLEQLFFHLQSDPEYLANLIQSPSSKDIDLLNTCLAPTFGFLTEKREQFLLVRLLCELLLRAVEKSKTPEDILKDEATEHIQKVLNSKLFASPHSTVVPSVSNELKMFFEEEGRMEAFNLNPDDIYLSIYGQKAADTGAAVQCPHVEQVLDSSKTFLAKWSEAFVDALTKSYKLPASIRYLGLYLEDILCRQFPSSPIVDVQKIVAEFVFESYLRPQLTSTRQLTTVLTKEPAEDGIHKLDAVTKFVGFAVANKGYGNTKWYLSSLNKQIHLIYESFKSYMHTQLSSQSLDDIFGMNLFTHFNPTHKPTLTIMNKQMEGILKLLKKNVDVIVPDKSRRIRDVIQSSHAPSDGDRSIILHLHPMTHSGDPRKQTQELFVRTKKYIVDILLSGCVGSDIPELLTTVTQDENEDIHKRLFNQGEQFSSLREKQKAATDNLRKLEELGRVRKDDGYQSIVTDIANDIRLATRRRKERVEQRQSLDASETRLETQRSELKERLTQYEEYLDTCLENLSRNARRLSFRPTTTKSEKIQKARTSVDTQQQSYKCSAEKLHKKGVLNSIEGYDNKKLSKISVEFAGTEKKGIFRVSVNEGKENILSSTLDFQNLLHAGYSEDEKFNIGNVVHCSVDGLTRFINKKFYNH